MAKDSIYIPEPKHTRLVKLAEKRGEKPAALVIRLITMYAADPLAYEKLFVQLDQQKQQHSEMRPRR